MIIAEATRFPELARAWHRAGPERAHATLAEQIEPLARRGLLRAPDPLLAAQHLNYLILSVPVNEAMFTGRPADRAGADCTATPTRPSGSSWPPTETRGPRRRSGGRRLSPSTALRQRARPAPPPDEPT